MDNSRAAGATVGVDVGGTFTDFVLFDPQRQQRFFHKQPSTPADPALAVSDGLRAVLLKSGLPASALSLVARYHVGPQRHYSATRRRHCAGYQHRFSRCVGNRACTYAVLF